jgi:hypothetical protein
MPILIPQHTVARPHGTIIISDPDAPHEIQRDVLMCVHCQEMWVVSPGSGRQRGYCLKCNGPICGPKCAECQGPLEKRIEMYERGLIAGL